MAQAIETQIPGRSGERLTQLNAVIEQVRFISDNGYGVVSARPANAPKGQQVFNVVGTIGDARAGERVIISGTWVNHGKYGLQLAVTDYDLPDLSGSFVREFLVDGFIKGVGRGLGERIWETFGERTAEIFDKEPDRLLKVKGIGKKALPSIVENWKEVAGKRAAILFFKKQLRLHNGIIRRIFDKWANPDLAMEEIRKNPYQLAWEIDGVGFPTADKAALSLGFAPDSFQRIEAALGYVLDEAATKEGHCYLVKSELFRRIQDYLNLECEELCEAALTRLCSMNRVYVEKFIGAESVYLKSLAKAEKGTAIEIRERLWTFEEDYDDAIVAALELFKAKNGIQLDAMQRAAVRMAVKNQTSVITGGPGTGKTTIIKAVIWVLGKLNLTSKIALCSPTGRAAKRMSESTGYDAATIHRMLGFNPREGFAYNEHNPLPADVVICDEASMLDTKLAFALVRALNKKCRLIFVGDVNQLPSVGAGSVLKEVIKSGAVPVATLSAIYRQTEGSYIALNAKAVLDGRQEDIRLNNDTDDFFFMGIKNPKTPPGERQALIQTGVVNCVSALMRKGLSLHDIQVLSPMKSRNLGVQELNKLLQKAFNPYGRLLYQGKEREFRVGDKVMQIRNNYDKDVFNGDQGVVLSGDDESLCVSFDGRNLAYKRDELNELTLAYAMTVHKSQGSEARAVIVILSTSHHIMLSRSIVYTAITRAKEICTLIGERQALKRAVDNNKVHYRYTHLGRLLQGKH